MAVTRQGLFEMIVIMGEFRMIKGKDNRKADKEQIPNAKGKKEFIVFGIQAKLIGAYMIPVVLIILLGYFSYSKASEAIIGNYKTAMRNTIEKTAEYYELLISTMDVKSKQLTSNSMLMDYYGGVFKEDPVKEKTNYDATKRQVIMDGMSDDNINAIAVMAPYGQNLVSVGVLGKDTYETYVQTEEGQAVLNGGSSAFWKGKHEFLDEQMGMDQSSYGLTISRQVIDRKMNPVGVLTLDIKRSALQKPLESIDLPEGSQCAFVTMDGREITAEGENETSLFFGNDFYITQTTSEQKTGLSYVEGSDEDYLNIYSKIGDTGCILNVLIPESKVTAQADEIKKITQIIVIGAIITAIMVGSIIASGIGRAIHKVNKVVKRVAEGDLTVVSQTRRKDEFRLLSGHITNMIASVRKLIDKTNKASGTIRESTESVTLAARDLVISSQSITETIQITENDIQNQSLQAKQCLDKMNGLGNKITIVNEGAEEISANTQNTKESIRLGMEKIENLNEKTGDTIHITHSIIADIEKLEKESQTIGGIIATINEIADQTNLLSLNASIEAARAGEAGRGFAVVADEIKKLADASLRASHEINEIVIGIQKTTKQTAMTARDAEQIVHNQEVELRETVTVFEDISQNIEKLSESIFSIAGKVEEIDQTKDETMEMIIDISQVLEQTAKEASKVKSEAEGQLEDSESLNLVVEKLTEQSRNLQDTIQSFKVE